MARVVLSAQQLCKSFGALEASKEVSLDLREGEIHALIGPNGAGKSTLIKQLCGELQPDSGALFLFEQEITKLSTDHRAQLGIGRSFQISSVLPEFTVLQNLLLAVQSSQSSILRFFRAALKDESSVTQARAAAERVGLGGRLTVPAADLAHGERRRLELAMALALKPKVFLLDEPMAGLGGEGAKEMTELLSGLRQEAPILLVEHDMDAVFSLADRITVLVYGEVIASGSPDQIKAHPEVRRAYLGDDFDLPGGQP